MEKRVIRGDSSKEYVFNNHVDSCIGTGRMGLALQKEYQDQLKFVQDYIGFKHIRGHGLFCDDMAIYQDMSFFDKNAPVEYNFTYLDLVMDFYLSIGIRPYLELGFMPYKLASGEQTIFYWKGNTTPPKDYDGWKKLIQATLRHLISRYGREEVVGWPVEVWNEPNLPGFWYKADMEEYFKLFKVSFEAVKEVDPAFKVGGPAVCGGSDKPWITAFMKFCHEQNIAVDYVSRHHYATTFPERLGHYGYAELMDPENVDDGFPDLHSTREIIDEYEEFKGLPIHITEFNTSYIPNCPLHDTNQNAAYIAHQLSRLGDDNVAYSYWTFGDLFEEGGVPFTPFHGGFGLVANGCIPKPTFWTFVFFKYMKAEGAECIYKDDTTVMVRLPDGSVRGITWNMSLKRAGKHFTNEYHVPVKTCGDESRSEHEYTLITRIVDEETCNPLKIWHDIGEPAHLTKEQTELIKSGAYPATFTRRLATETDEAVFDIPVKENGVVYFELRPVRIVPDRGYDYDRVMQMN
ncbi:MAG: xylan 1,4-beta-xylosidase [Lachnospiraceae bacterium]|nr:xylan 1,4-beta-xylosidase [Lachnospiraceae bacterium]